MQKWLPKHRTDVKVLYNEHFRIAINNNTFPDFNPLSLKYVYLIHPFKFVSFESNHFCSMNLF